MPRPGTDDEVTNATAMNAWWKNYHEFAVDFSPTHVTFYLNGHAYSNVTSHSRGTPNATAPILPASPFYVLLNTALGGHVRPVEWRFCSSKKRATWLQPPLPRPFFLKLSPISGPGLSLTPRSFQFITTLTMSEWRSKRDTLASMTKSFWQTKSR